MSVWTDVDELLEEVPDAASTPIKSVCMLYCFVTFLTGNTEQCIVGI